LTLNAKGLIKRANLTAVILLGKLRRVLSGSEFGQFIATGWADVFGTARRKAIETGEKASIELPLKNTYNPPLSYEINPPVLHRNGLMAALGELAKDMKTGRGLAITVRTQSDAEPSSLSLASILYRSIKELLSNVIRHAGVAAAVLDIRNNSGLICVKVQDNGNGFDFNAVRAMQGKGSGFSLFNIEDRMTFLGGSMKVSTQPGEGCCVVLTVPKDVSQKSAVP
jgi:signal transduction histidine kinase